MAKKKQHHESEPGPEDDAVPTLKPAGPIGTSMRDLLKDVKLPKTPAVKAPPKKKHEPPPAVRPIVRRPAEPAAPGDKEARPSESLRGTERTAFLDALAGVRPLPGRGPIRIGAVASPPSPPSPADRDRDAAARAKLAALVAGAVRFEIRREQDWIEGIRSGGKPGVLAALRKASVGGSATLDLHGLRAEEAESRVGRFVRDAQRAGVRRVLIVHGRGLHAEGGRGVLGEVVVRTLTEGAGAPFTMAFINAPPTLGGAGALLVELTAR